MAPRQLELPGLNLEIPPARHHNRSILSAREAYTAWAELRIRRGQMDRAKFKFSFVI